MIAIGLPFDRARQLVEPWADRIAVAVSNGPNASVLSGDPAALEAVLADLRERDVFCRPVQVDVASHSPQVDALGPDLLAQLAGVRPSVPVMPIYSTVTAQRETGAIFDAAYWRATSASRSCSMQR
jgi:acyl transferase domain-containing protein